MPIKQELYRKIFHLFLFLIPFFFIKFGKSEFLKLFIPIAIIIIIIDYYRCKFDKLNFIASKFFKLIMRDKEINQKKTFGHELGFWWRIIEFLDV